MFRRHTLLFKGFIGLFLKTTEDIFYVCKLDCAFPVPAVTFRLRPARVQRNIGGDRAESAKNGLAGGDQYFFHHVQGKSGRMGRSRAAERIQHELAGIVALFNSDCPQQIHHAGVDNPFDSGGGFLNRQRERVSHMNLNRLPRFFLIQGQFPAQKPGRVDDTENHVSVGHGREFSTKAVTGRTRFGPGALRSYVDVSALLNTCNGTAAGADGPHVQHGKQQVILIGHGFPALSRLACCDDRHVR